eukprot:jgi/Galph1/2361/GphlegSOOS_G36.1
MRTISTGNWLSALCTMEMSTKQEERLHRIETFVHYILKQLIKGKFVMTEEFKLRNLYSVCRLILLTDKIHTLLSEGASINQRELFYQIKHVQVMKSCLLFPTQLQVDQSIRKLTGLLKMNRSEMSIYPNYRGFLGGAIAFITPISVVNCLEDYPDGWCIPGSMECLRQMEIRNLGAQYILIIEKHGIFKRLLEDRFIHRVPSILICGQGYPSIAAKYLFQKIASELQLPCLGLVDYNPHGLALLQTYGYALVFDFQFLFVYCFSDNRRTSCPYETFQCTTNETKSSTGIQWVGLHFSQLQQLQLWDNFHKPLTKRDEKILKNLRCHLLSESNQSSLLEQELAAMQNGKADLQAIFSLGTSYFSYIYLPMVIFHHRESILLYDFKYSLCT